ncbi:MAG: HAMP domain-containing methyl-accepting chemotaxis protein [Desulfobulbaceae bacterium]|nr:HAMP domain-containing methyl-accepting chemotaxis protein [Desulfobulbaceae bacterium]
MEGKLGFIKNLTNLAPIRLVTESIRNKLLFSIILMATIPLVVMGFFAINLSTTAIETQTLDSLEAMEDVYRGKMKDFFAEERDVLKGFADNPFVRELGPQMIEGVEEMGVGDHEAATEILRSAYLNKPDLVDAGDGSLYSLTHIKLHQYIGEFNKLHGYRDTYLVDGDGHVIYNATKSDLFGKVLTNEKYRNTGLGQAFDKAAYYSIPGEVVFEDFSQSPVIDKATGFFAIAINLNEEGGAIIEPEHMSVGEGVDLVKHDAEDKLIVITELDIDIINEQMSTTIGLGRTGEVYLVGPDGLWRCNSRFLKDMGVTSTMMDEKYLIDTVAFKDAIASNHGKQVIIDYRGKAVFSSWGPLVVQEPTAANPEGAVIWAMMAEMDESEVHETPNALRNNFLIILVVSFLVVIALTIWLSNALVKQTNAIMGVFSSIGMGDFEARAEIHSADELGHVADSLNTMLDNTMALIQSREERDVIQNSIMRLLEDVAGLADGDLTVDAEVTADVTGAIADSYNFMIEQLRDIISNVQDATLQVSSSANEIQTTAEHLAQGSESQAMQITDTSAAIDEMAVSIQQVSENAATSTQVGEQSKANAAQGTKAVQDTIEGMNRIREQVQETSKRIKRLGESSQEIGEITQLISDIADRTSILALNASIQAAMAGDAGRGFAVVAEEVERLAERSTNATKQIDSLVKTIQSETNEAMTAMETTTNEVVEGTKLTDQAGKALWEIDAVSGRLAELIQSISLAAKQQARGSEALSASMVDIAEVTQQTAAGTKQAAVSINNLAVLADSLRGSLSRFKLPDDYQRGA